MANGLPPGIKTLATPEDIARETLTMLGAPIDLGADIQIPAPTVGSLALLDLCKSPLTVKEAEWNPDRIREAVFILCEGKLAASIVARENAGFPVNFEAVYAGAGDCFKRFCGAFDSGELSLADISVALGDAIKDAISGFALMPSRGNRDQDWPRFNSEWIARLAITASQCGLSLSYFQLVWGLPLCAVSHLVAAGAAKHGVQLRRPIDEDSMLASLKALNNT